MPIQTALWKVASTPRPLPAAKLESESQLEEMIVEAPAILSEEWMLIGRQEDTGYGGRIDLLAIAPDSSLVLIELKRERTPREVVAQALDYATWVEQLRPDEVARVYSRFAPGRNLAEDFHQRFKLQLDEEAFNSSHQIVIVASSLDASTERIVGYLSSREIPINVLCFQVFASGDDQVLSRAWLLDPVQSQTSAASGADRAREPWNGEFYCSFGHSEARSWPEALKHGFICAGGGSWYNRTLQLLEAGDRVWVNVPGRGYVGVARVLGPSRRGADFELTTEKGPRPALEVLNDGHYGRIYDENPELWEYFVPVQWLDSVPLDRAIHEAGFFGNQNTICKPTTPKWRSTVERLKERFPAYDRVESRQPQRSDDPVLA